MARLLGQKLTLGSVGATFQPDVLMLRLHVCAMSEDQKQG